MKITQEGITAPTSEPKNTATQPPTWVGKVLGHPLSILIILTTVVLCPCLLGGFVWDDVQYVVHNDNLRDLQGLIRIWFEPSTSPQYYPVTFTTYWVEYQFHKLDPAGYHFLNFCLHLANMALVYVLLKQLGLVRLAWLAALVFGIHPLHVEPVAWISARKDLLSTLFALLTLSAWLRIYQRPSIQTLALPLALFLTALLSKTAVCPLPVIMVLAAWWLDGNLTRKVWTASLPFFVLSGIAVWMFGHFEKASIDSARQMVQYSLLERILIAGHAFWFYIVKTLYPYPLMSIYPRWPIDSSSLSGWVYPATVILFLGALYAYRHRLGRGALICLAVYAFLVTPYLGLTTWAFSRFSFVADRYVYLAGIGLIIPLSHGLLYLSNYFEEKGMRGYLPIVALLLPFAAISFSQSLLYRDAETLFRRNLKHNPDSWGVHTAMGAVALTETGQIETAIEHFQEAVKLEPGASQAHYNLAVALEANNKPDEAIQEYQRTLELEPEYAEAHNNLGILLTNRGLLREALQHFNEAVRLKPEQSDFRENKNMLLQRINQPAPALPPGGEASPVTEAPTEALSPEPEAGPGRDPEYDHPVEQGYPR